MKRLFLVVAAVVAASVSSANAQAVWGARVGLAAPSVKQGGSSSYSGIDYSVEGEYGIEIGPIVYYPLTESWYINAGVSFSIKTFSSGSESLSTNWITIPVYLGYAIPLGPVQTYVQVGPFYGKKLSESLSGGNTSIFASSDAGVGIMYGINIKKFKVEAGYQIGLVNVANTPSGDDSGLESGSFFVGVSYVF